VTTINMAFMNGRKKQFKENGDQAKRKKINQR
jgi:hypothetical protein